MDGLQTTMTGETVLRDGLGKRIDTHRGKRVLTQVQGLHRHQAHGFWRRRVYARAALPQRALRSKRVHVAWSNDVSKRSRACETIWTTPSTSGRTQRDDVACTATTSQDPTEPT